MLWSVLLPYVTILGVANKKTLPFTSLFLILLHRSCLALLNRWCLIVIFFSISYSVLGIRTLASNWTNRWHYKRFSSVTHANFITPRPHFYSCNFCRSEVIGMTSDFSEHTVYACHLILSSIVHQFLRFKVYIL